MFWFVAAYEFGQWTPESALWKQRLDYRAEQIARIPNSQERWDGLMNLATTGLLVPNFTKIGYAVVATPSSVQDKLNATLFDALQSGRLASEGTVDQISGPVADMVPLGQLKSEVLRTMQPTLEAWAGVSLLPSMAYGLRLYREGNTLTMHTDKLETHVVSAIVHVNREVQEPWPIAIEGYDGRTTEVDLQPGETLLYESAKCVHGRPRPLKGNWYTSLFIHYRPRDWRTRTPDAKAIVEPLFFDFTKPPDPRYKQLRLRGTGYYEPECPHNWCDLSPVWPPADPTASEL